uniref:Shroom family member 3 n=2 Tax=Microcebus murinus TaxID=30608 RepID=A0A8C5V8S6_MICMU
MESLEPSGHYPPCHLLCPAKPTSSIDQPGRCHSKRDSAYGSLSTSSSVLERPPPGVSGREHAGSADAAAARGGLLEGPRQADIRYIKTVYDPRQGVSAEYEVDSTALLLPGREARAPAGGQGCDKWYNVPRVKGAPPPPWSHPGGPLPPEAGAPLPPARSDSYAAFRHRERPSSWSSLDKKRFCWPQANSLGAPKPPLLEQQLHRVPEGSPESSPPAAQPGRPLLPTGVYPVPSLEPHFAQVPRPSAGTNGTVYPALARESGYAAPQGAHGGAPALGEDGNQNASSRPGSALHQPLARNSPRAPVESTPGTVARCVSSKVHFPSGPENEEATPLKRHLPPPQGSSPRPVSERKSTHRSEPGSGHHGPTAPQAQAWHAGEDKRLSRPSEPREGDVRGDHNASLPRRQERGLGQSLASHCGKAKSAFSSLQNIPESLRWQSSLELGGGAQEGSPGGSPSCARDPGRKAAPAHGGRGDQQACCPAPQRRASASSHSSDPRCEELAAPQTAGLGWRGLGSGSASALQGFQNRKAPCSVLEKVSEIEQREQGSQSAPGAGSCTYSQSHRPSRTAPTPKISGNDLEETKANIRLSESAEALDGGQQHFKHWEPTAQEGSWPLCGRQCRGAAGGARGDGEPRRPDTRLLRSQSTFQLFGEEAEWPHDRPGTPESPLQDAPLSRAYRNSIKGAQSRVLGATSFRRRDLELGAPAASRPWQPRPSSAHAGLRSPEAPAALSSPHTPRERRSVTPAAAGPAPCASRRGARRRLTPEQKKRSYSEPERMNEVGVSEEAEPDAQRTGPRSADSRAVEQRARAALGLSGPELRQFQQSALAAYVHRKTGQRPASAGGCAFLQPGLPSASSLSSLREPSLQPRRDAAVPEPGRAPRDRSSSFAGDRLEERWCWDPQTPRELLSGANVPRGTQRVEGTPGEPSSWGAAARRAGKSMSAEDLLERSDVLAVPVHVRSRSSPTADKKRQDALFGEGSSFGLTKDPCYVAGPVSRSPGCSERGSEELLPLHPGPRWTGSSVPSECPGALDHRRRASRTPCCWPARPGVPAQLRDTRVLPALGCPLPPPARASCGPEEAASDEAGSDQVPAGPPGSSGSRPQPPGPRGCQASSPELELMAAEGGGSRRLWWPPPALQGKGVPTGGEAGPPGDSSPPEVEDQSHCGQQQRFPNPHGACDPAAPPAAPGVLPLRGSPSPPREDQEDQEDDVFLRDSHPVATCSPTLGAPLLPPLSQEARVGGRPAPPAAAPLGLGGQEAPGASKFPKVTMARERHVPGAACLEGSQILASTPQTSIEGVQASEPSPPSVTGVQPRLAGSLSQTESLSGGPAGGTRGLEKKVSSDPPKSSEDIRTEALAKEIAHQDRSLAGILDPDSRMKTTLDLMEGLFPRDSELLTEDSVKRKALPRAVSCPGCECNRSGDLEAACVLVYCPAYCGVAAPKAELLDKVEQMPVGGNEEEEQADVNEKKAELVGSLVRRLQGLQEARARLLSDTQRNNALGEQVEALVSERCKPNELDKYRMFVGDLGKVVNLLLSLSGRLARVENVLSSLGEDASREERRSLDEKRRALAGQHADARELKENLDRRGGAVLGVLAGRLSRAQLQDYQRFVRMKPALLIARRELDDEIALGREQVRCLLQSLPPGFVPAAGALALPPD